jgi:glutamyl-tRNA(Gln) amidotransferase subunit E
LKKDDFEHTYVDISHLFQLEDKVKAFATVFPKMKGLLGLEVQPNKDFGLDVFEKSMLITGIPQEDHFHSDEMKGNAVRMRSDHPSKLPIDRKKYAEICSILKPGPDDAFIVVVGLERRAMHAMKKIVERVKAALDGVPKETRRPLPNGNSEFLRVIHGKERIYPDTDTPPIVISRELVQECWKMVGKRPWEIFEDLHGKYSLSQDQVDLLIRDEKVEKFYGYVGRLRLSGHLAYRLLVELQRWKRRKGLRVSEYIVDRLAESLSRRIITPAQVDPLTDLLAKEPSLTVDEAASRLKKPFITESRLNNLLLKQLENFDKSRMQSDEAYRKLAVSKIVGAILERVNRAVDGKKVSDKVCELIKKG